LRRPCEPKSRPAGPDGSDEPHENDSLVAAHGVEQVLVSVDEGLLDGVVETSRHGFRFAIVKAQTMKQSDPY
jgi:hypothetical protein